MAQPSRPAPPEYFFYLLYHVVKQRDLVLGGVLESTARPIRSPATGAEHRVRINLPNGIEFDVAEIGSGTTKTVASVALDLTDTYCHFTFLRQSGKGAVHP